MVTEEVETVLGIIWPVSRWWSVLQESSVNSKSTRQSCAATASSTRRDCAATSGPTPSPAITDDLMHVASSVASRDADRRPGGR